jgi:hypothetical protein
MFCVIVMLTVALVPTGYGSWHLYPGRPVICIFTNLPGDWVDGLGGSSTQTGSMTISITVLFFSYLIRVIKLYSISSKLARKYLRSKPGNLLKRLIRWAEDPRLLMPVHDFLSVQLVIFRVLFDFFESMLWEVCTSLLILKYQPLRNPT